LSGAASGADDAIEVVVALIEDDRGRVLVNQRRPGTHMAGFWEFPGGKRGRGEGRREALGRELLEELGIRLLEAQPLMKFSHDYPGRRVRLDVWRVQRYEGEPTPCEEQPIRWCYPRELLAQELLPADRPIVEALLVR